MAKFYLLTALMCVLACAESNSSSSSQSMSEDFSKALDTVKNEFTSIVRTAEWQPFVALLSFGFGVAAIYDGRKFFKYVVILFILGMTFCLALVLLDADMSGLSKCTSAVEISLAVGFAAYVGWGGTQLLLGLCGGVWMFKGVKWFTTVMVTDVFKLKFDVNASDPYLITTYTLCVAIGIWGLHDSEKGGAKRIFGLIAPVVGGSMVIAACGYTALKSVSLCEPIQTALHVPKITEVPAVEEFWAMMLHPATSKAVGIFALANPDQHFMNDNINADKIIALLVWFLFSVFGIRLQCKRLSKSSSSSSLVAPLMPKSKTRPPPV